MPAAGRRHVTAAISPRLAPVQGMARLSCVGTALPLLLLATMLLRAAHAAPAVASASDVSGLTEQARAVADGGSLTVSNVALESEARPAALELQEASVWAPGARVLVQQQGGAAEQRPPSATRIFSGGLAGSDTSTVVMSVRADGAIEGVVREGDKTWALAEQTTPAGPSASARSATAAAAAAAAPANLPTVHQLVAPLAPSSTGLPFTCGAQHSSNASVAFDAWLEAGGAGTGGRRLNQVGAAWGYKVFSCCCCCSTCSEARPMAMDW